MPGTDDHGPLLLIGGAEDKLGSRTILARFVALAGGTAARIAVIATASAYHDLVGHRYVALFSNLGAASVELLHLHDRTDAQHRETLHRLTEATGIFLTGGDQLKLTAVLGGTPVAEQIRRRHRQGAVIGGTSAGASAAAEHMVAYGAGGFPPRKAMLHFAPGLGLIGGVVIDQHFGARARTGRLIAAVAHNPELIGIGLDEDTAAEIDARGCLTVLGRGAVMIADGAEISHTDIHTVPEQAPLALFGLRLHVLTRGYRFDLPSRTPHLPSEPQPYPEVGYMGGEGI